MELMTATAKPTPAPLLGIDALADNRWAAVLGRDGAHDGEFVYAVRTTGVYCRPSCPSRTARRENVVFFDTTLDAQAAGYRACRRCGPDGVSLALRRAQAVQEACRSLEASDSGVPLAVLAQAAGLSPHHFHRSFKAVTGLTPKAYFKAVQARRVQAGLGTSASVTQALYDAGYNSASRFYGADAATLGMAPATYRSGAAGQHIRYAVEPCALGVVLVAATPKGVCAIEFGQSAHTLVEGLQSRFPKATLVPGDPDFRHWMGQILHHIEHPASLLDLPLDIQGTVFQRRVWDALRRIPCGQTASYAEVAAAIGQPTAVRAVAQACAGNPVALAVPCHRVVRSDGSLSGYRWGTERKALLLERESEA
jgi:AraC family transcriptional regulator of adaptative response/methylated-DNA-[protein]-cysteine methyltransferase